MFCSKCGTVVPDDASFCHKCGSALTPIYSQPNYSQPNYSQPDYYSQPNYAQPNYSQPNYSQPDYYSQPNYSQPDYYSQPTPNQAPPANNGVTIKCGGNVVYPDGHSEIGDLYISSSEIRFVKKSTAVRLAFGLLGSALESGHEALRLNIYDIVNGQRTQIGINPNVYQITMRNGCIYKLCFLQSKNITYLEQILSNR